MSFAARVDEGSPRYFRHRASRACDVALELAGVALVDAAAGSEKVRVRVRYDGGPARTLATLIPGEVEYACVHARFVDGDVRFSCRGGSVELVGRVEAETRADDEAETSSSDEAAEYGSDASWGSDVEESREREVGVVESAGEDAATKEAAARANAVASRRWRTLDEVRSTLHWWDAPKDSVAEYHIQKSGAKRSSKSKTLPAFDWTGKLQPREISAKRSYPSGLNPPDYAVSGWPDEEFGSRYQSVIEVKPQSARDGCALRVRWRDTLWTPSPGLSSPV